MVVNFSPFFFATAKNLAGRPKLLQTKALKKVLLEAALRESSQKSERVSKNLSFPLHFTGERTETIILQFLLMRKFCIQLFIFRDSNGIREMVQR